MKKLSLKNLKLEANNMLERNQLKTIFGGYGATQCWAHIQYDDGYTYSASQGADIDGCRALVGTSYQDRFGNFSVTDCFCTSYY